MFPTLKMIVIKNKDLFIILSIFLFCLFSIALHPFWITGDTPTYLNSIEFLKGNFRGENFVPFRIISTYLALNILIFAEKLFGNLFLGWTVMGIGFYVLAGYCMYKIIHEIYESTRVALLGTLLLLSNYAVAIHGLAFALDLGGWAFYLTSAYFSLMYLKTENKKYILFAGAMIGLGSLFKEYAFGGYPILIGVIVYNNFKDLKEILKLVSIASMLSFLPAIILHLFVYLKFDYTYLDWYREQGRQYGGTYYKSRVIEYIKSFGAVYGFGWLLFIYSWFLLIKSKFKLMNQKFLFFFILLFLSATPVFFWPGIVPRTVFIMIPFAIAVSCLTFKHLENYWYLSVPFIGIYVSWGYLLDKYIFNAMNIDSVLKYILFWLY